MEGIEPSTSALRKLCSTVELHRRINVPYLSIGTRVLEREYNVLRKESKAFSVIYNIVKIFYSDICLVFFVLKVKTGKYLAILFIFKYL